MQSQNTNTLTIYTSTNLYYIYVCDRLCSFVRLYSVKLIQHILFVEDAYKVVTFDDFKESNQITFFLMISAGISHHLNCHYNVTQSPIVN